MLGEGGDRLEWPGHGEVGGGGASAGSEEEDVMLGDSSQFEGCEQAEEKH